MDSVEGLALGPVIWTASQEELLRQPYNHLVTQPGKNFRNTLIRVFNGFYGLSERQVAAVTELVEMLHVASLLIDDIEDNSAWRRGVAAAHVVYGSPMTINTANYMYFVSMSLLGQLAAQRPAGPLQDLLKVFNEEMMNLHRGQGLDIYWRDTFTVPSEHDYLRMVMHKTGGLFRLTVRIMEALREGPDGPGSTLVPLSNLLGVLYQVRDDYLNLTDSRMSENKGFADDITEGKFSYPIIHGLQYARVHDPAGYDFLVSVLRQRTTDITTKRRVVRYLADVSGSLAYTKQRIIELATLIKTKYIPASGTELCNVIDSLTSF
ncbi:AEL238Cp [Eremothecium gossypii ATCC 10895]|uniref:Geranylgeranyl pyrophosphate synthase n=1 Tax=Eremothecium gossypii (strain ATCC 10895 / CBS 109.51 / FGSC 9923 / NRRL Y-1056) TaxID=284811 RepID=GGPPS_EREGS|nr:AEL238Cp [Eremothecium gossypii ATCC 10895]Q758K0.1 RecName: Full=Geranylgeranyl pyrophosphate synthase; Short=GGPP synthase; Short=GGPPSase; AltName: Full=(2E,6E)-farnesyl diphosphate synthase; AltName: Full=Dimethylallyltranstransferase; AltName: Full=Farnesyl diphosphate synthase; AltName: Full=Farnesyltranstransferase; AltName: Full=Geranylgeranyl diphosphate synthase; AltName: Full=Geranyltranstransferase [Eremothecium gossypii ATCC 10895]AAS52447.1 AEL238Cp [Eremothecium gossypii ATCC 10